MGKRFLHNLYVALIVYSFSCYLDTGEIVAQTFEDDGVLSKLKAVCQVQVVGNQTHAYVHHVSCSLRGGRPQDPAVLENYLKSMIEDQSSIRDRSSVARLHSNVALSLQSRYPAGVDLELTRGHLKSTSCYQGTSDVMVSCESIFNYYTRE